MNWPWTRFFPPKEHAPRSICCNNCGRSSATTPPLEGGLTAPNMGFVLLLQSSMFLDMMIIFAHLSSGNFVVFMEKSRRSCFSCFIPRTRRRLHLFVSKKQLGRDMPSVPYYINNFVITFVITFVGPYSSVRHKSTIHSKNKVQGKEPSIMIHSEFLLSFCRDSFRKAVVICDALKSATDVFVTDAPIHHLEKSADMKRRWRGSGGPIALILSCLQQGSVTIPSSCSSPVLVKLERGGEPSPI